jgi:hypothetical protein
LGLNGWIRERERKRREQTRPAPRPPAEEHADVEPARGLALIGGGLSDWIAGLLQNQTSSIERLLGIPEEVRYKFFAVAEFPTRRTRLPVVFVVTDRAVVLMRVSRATHVPFAREVIKRLPLETRFGPLFKEPERRWGGDYTVVDGKKYRVSRNAYGHARGKDYAEATRGGDIIRCPDDGAAGDGYVVRPSS